MFPSFKVTCTCIFNLLISSERLDVLISVATDEISRNGSDNSEKMWMWRILIDDLRNGSMTDRTLNAHKMVMVAEHTCRS